VLSKKKFRGRDAILTINQAALMFVPVAVAIPRFLMIKQLGLLDHFLSHILPLLAMPVGLFLVKQFIDQVPDSLVEAAQIDGCTDYGILFRIIIPVIRPALATVSILSFQSAWNSVEASQLFIEREKIKTFAYYLSALTSATGSAVSAQGMAAAAVLIMVVPNIVLFIVMQSRVMNTVAYSGIK
jgi:multiple sugar transport system permease protein